MVGLISIVALAAVQGSGSSVNALMTDVSDTLDGAITSGAGAGGSAPASSVAPSPSASPSPVGFTASYQFSTANSSACTAMNNWRSSLVIGAYTTIEISGSELSGTVTCTGAQATALCDALANGTKHAELCDGFYWSTNNWGGTNESILVSANGVYTNHGSFPNDPGGSCTADTGGGGWIRPCINNVNWGGMNGPTCGAPTQTMGIACY
ncbi:MAG: hypothetical protein Alpg2KO_06020 [Alphaproteobacteria bacterium]